MCGIIALLKIHQLGLSTMANWVIQKEKTNNELLSMKVMWGSGTKSPTPVRKVDKNAPILFHDDSVFEVASAAMKRGVRDKVLYGNTYLKFDNGQGDLFVELFSSTELFADIFKTHWSGTIIGESLVTVETESEQPEVTENPDVIFIAYNLSVDQIKSKSLGVRNNTKAVEIGNASLRRRRRLPVKPSVSEVAGKLRKDSESASSELKAGKNRKKVTNLTRNKNNNSDNVKKEINLDLDLYKKIKIKTIVAEFENAFCIQMKNGLVVDLVGIKTKMPLLFRKKSHAREAQVAISQMKPSKTKFCLYISHTIDGTGQVGTNSIGDRAYYKCLSASSEVIDLIMNSWAGTPLGYSMVKSMSTELGDLIDRKSEGYGVLKQLLDGTDKISKTSVYNQNVAS